MTAKLRLGRIGYLNVLPIYLPLEDGLGQGDIQGVEIVSGPPSELNRLMAAGELDVSAVSSIAYARQWDRCRLVPDLAIGSRGPVQSVLLLSRAPVEELGGETILVSSQTHTSAALLRLLMAERYGVGPAYETGDATAQLQAGGRPTAILAIGDEALRLRGLEDYPHTLDLGRAWMEWTGKPFIFGVWVASESALAERPAAVAAACDLLQRAKRQGVADMARIVHLAALGSGQPEAAMRSYFDGLVYDLGPAEQDGLALFYQRLAAAGELEASPPLRFVGE